MISVTSTESVADYTERVRVLLSDGSSCEGWSGVVYAEHMSSTDGIFVLYGCTVSPLLGAEVENVTVLIPWDRVNMYVVLNETLPFEPVRDDMAS